MMRYPWKRTEAALREMAAPEARVRREGHIRIIPATEVVPGDVILLENVRFHAGETKNDPEFAKALAENADIYVNNAFGTAHRAHASTEGVTHYLQPAAAGFLLEKEQPAIMRGPLIAGILVASLAERQFKRRDTPVKPFQTSRVLVTDGMFRLSRNPMYLGLAAALIIGVTLHMPTKSSLVEWIERQLRIIEEQRKFGA